MRACDPTSAVRKVANHLRQGHAERAAKALLERGYPTSAKVGRRPLIG